MTKYLFIIAAALSITACGNKKDSNKTEVVTKKAMLIDGVNDYKDNASTTINNAYISENNMVLDIVYSGGCEDHEFSLLGSKMIAKSLPAKRGIFLYHQNNGDSCRELIEETLTFDISDFAYTGEEIILLLEGYKEPLTYSLK